MKNLPEYEDFLNEALVILTLKGTMKNEFMRDLILKEDFEIAKRAFFIEIGSSILTHISSDKFELRNYIEIKKEELDELISTKINPLTKRMKFRRIGIGKKDKIKEFNWFLKAEI